MPYNEKNLDIKCFPTIFPTGRFGKDAIRTKSLTDTMFVRSRLRQKDRRFMNAEYLFHLCHYADMKIITGSINFMMRASRELDQTVVLQNIITKNPKLEADLTTSFSKWRNNEGYWRIRNLELHNHCQ